MSALASKIKNIKKQAVEDKVLTTMQVPTRQEDATQEFTPKIHPKTEIKIHRVEKREIPKIPKISEELNTVTAQAPAPEQKIIKKTQEPASKIQGRFIARLRKSEEPKPTIIQSAQDAVAEGQFDKAEEILIPHLMKHPKDTKAYMVLGTIAIENQNWDEAIQIFEQIIKINPEEPDAQAGLGYSAMQNGRYSISLRALQRAHESDPQNIKILEQLLNIAKRLDNKIVQKSVLSQLIELEHKNSEQYQEELTAILAKDRVRA